MVNVLKKDLRWVLCSMCMLITLYALCSCEKDDEFIDADDKDETVIQTEPTMATFPGGPDKLMEYLKENIKYPKEAERIGVEGRVVCTFLVTEDGSVADVKVAISVHPLLDAEAVRVISTMPKWIPGEHMGKPIRIKYTLPITFRLLRGNSNSTKVSEQ